jgi:DNA repair exonuclease SbcCD ATPase subunit
MQTTNVGFSVTVESNDASKSIKELRQEIEKTTKAVEDLGTQYGENSKEVEAAQKRLANLQDLTNQKQEENTQRLDNAAKTVTALSAAYGGVQGALELTGLAGEDTIKQLAKIQSALAIGDAVQNLSEFREAITSTFTDLRNGAVKAFQAVKAGIGATGIGALLLALGGIVAFWDDIKAAVGGVSEEQKKLLEDTQAEAKAQQDKLSTIDSQDNILKLQGKSEKEILDLKIKQTGEVISATEKQVAQQKIVLQAQLSAEKRNKEILKGILTFVTAPLQLVIDGVNKVAKVFGKGFDFNVAEKLSGLVFDPKETEKKGQEEIAALDKTLNDLKNKQAGYQLSIQGLNKQTSDAAKANADKLAEEQSARLDKQLQDEKKLTEDLLAEYDKRKKLASSVKTLSQKELAALDAAQAKEDKEKQDKINNDRIDGQMKVVASTTNFALQGIQQQQEATKNSAENISAVNKWLASEDKKRLDEKVADTQMALDALSAIVDQNSVAGKAIAVAQAIINTYQGATKALGQGGALGFVTAGAVIAAGIMNVKKIVSTKIPSAKGTGSVEGGAAAPSISSSAPIAPPQPQAQTTTLDSQSINAIGSQTTRAYVIESDVTSSQQRIAAIQQRARFG